ncbi:hypothetical protein [Desulfosarcina ovata]|uniref:hypothetical protein n=1 Tax=Desulfosarcina ovata TaxID=83564 RepID=UPI0012D334F5|nr:hypothetical protein [Desulfosarcina ovata]
MRRKYDDRDTDRHCIELVLQDVFLFSPALCLMLNCARLYSLAVLNHEEWKINQMQGKMGKTVGSRF